MAVYDWLKVSNFEIILHPQSQKLELMVQEVNIPGFTLGDIHIGHPSQSFHHIGDDINWNPLVLTVLCDEDLDAYVQCYNLITKTKNPKTGELVIDVIKFDGVLFITTNKNNTQYRFFFKDCWIFDLSDLRVSTTSSDAEHINFTVTIYYDYFEIEKVKK